MRNSGVGVQRVWVIYLGIQTSATNHVSAHAIGIGYSRNNVAPDMSKFAWGAWQSLMGALWLATFSPAPKLPPCCSSTELFSYAPHVRQISLLVVKKSCQTACECETKWCADGPPHSTLPLVDRINTCSRSMSRHEQRRMSLNNMRSPAFAVVPPLKLLQAEK